ncbi:hypothetical protein ACTZKP_12790 [Escherichia coli]
MPRRQILSSEEQERLLVIPDDEIILTRMCFLNEPGNDSNSSSTIELHQHVSHS